MAANCCHSGLVTSVTIAILKSLETGTIATGCLIP
jgi:hypothetical protein